MDLRVPSSRRTILGATLTVSTVNGWSVSIGNDYLGYLHASIGNRFNAYRRRRSQPDEWLCKADLVEGVRSILLASGKTIGEAD